MDADSLTDVLKEGYTCRLDAIKEYAGDMYPLKTLLSGMLMPKLRFLAETDPSFKQIIPYAIVEHEHTGKFFVTKRVGGDERLIGQISLGQGGHVERGEGIGNALNRELEEEIGLLPEDISDHFFCGYINTNESEIDRVHVGLIYHLFTERDDLRSMEPDKLDGFWATLDEIRTMYDAGLLESWSRLVFEHTLGGGAA